MEQILQTALDGINKKLDDIKYDIEKVEKKVDRIENKQSDQAAEIGSIKTSIEYIQKDQGGNVQEHQRIWDHFTKQKEGLEKQKDDMAQYARDQDSATIGKMKVWVYTAIGTMVLAAIGGFATLLSILGDKK